MYGIFGCEITKYTVIYGVYIRFWPTLHILNHAGVQHTAGIAILAFPLGALQAGSIALNKQSHILTFIHIHTIIHTGVQHTAGVAILAVPLGVLQAGSIALNKQSHLHTHVHTHTRRCAAHRWHRHLSGPSGSAPGRIYCPRSPPTFMEDRGTHTAGGYKLCVCGAGVCFV
jgi:hypothetical protein